MTKQQAKKLCIKKWEWIVNNNGKVNILKMIKDIPKIVNIFYYCAYCELYINMKIRNCPKCPLDKLGECCNIENSIYDKWRLNQTRENAQAMLDLIRRS